MRNRGTTVPNNHTEHIQNGAQNTNVTKSLPEHKSAQGSSVPKKNTEHIQNSAQATDET